MAPVLNDCAREVLYERVLRGEYFLLGVVDNNAIEFFVNRADTCCGDFENVEDKFSCV